MSRFQLRKWTRMGLGFARKGLVHARRLLRRGDAEDGFLVFVLGEDGEWKRSRQEYVPYNCRWVLKGKQIGWALPIVERDGPDGGGADADFRFEGSGYFYYMIPF